jgi:hypothetical protein
LRSSTSSEYPFVQAFTKLTLINCRRELRQDIASIKSPANQQLTHLVDRRTKLARQIKRLRSLQLSFIPIALQVVATLPPSKIQLNAEDIPLYLPSGLSQEQQSKLSNSLAEMEIRLRDGQLNESLNNLRNAILVKQRLLRYKKVNARHQGATTRSRALITRQEKKIKLAAATYRAAWKAKLSLHRGDVTKVGWKQLLDEHIVGMEELQASEQQKIKVSKAKRAAAARSLQDGENPLEGAREKHRTSSWIWHSVTKGELEADEVLYQGKGCFPMNICKS